MLTYLPVIVKEKVFSHSANRDYCRRDLDRGSPRKKYEPLLLHNERIIFKLDTKRILFCYNCRTYIYVCVLLNCSIGDILKLFEKDT